MNNITALFGAIGVVIGGIITSLLSLWKEKIMFRQNLIKEDRIRKDELFKREDDLVRRLISRLFGLNFAIIHSAKVYNVCLIDGAYYCRMADLEVNRVERPVFIELMREQNNLAQSGLAKFVGNIQELSEIIGEYAYLMPETKVGEAYSKFICLEFHTKYNFESINNVEDLKKHREIIIIEQLKKNEVISQNIVDILKIVGDESHKKYKIPFQY
jgi:hypothetical protein